MENNIYDNTILLPIYIIIYNNIVYENELFCTVFPSFIAQRIRRSFLEH